MTMLYRPVDLAQISSPGGAFVTLTKSDGLLVLNQMALLHSPHRARCWRTIAIATDADTKKLVGLSGVVVIDTSFLDGASDGLQRLVDRMIRKPDVHLLNLPATLPLQPRKTR